MSSNDETYNGYSNRETWAFNLHWQNDQGLYNETLMVAQEQLRDIDDDGNDIPNEGGRGSSATDYALGEHVVSYWRDLLDGYEEFYGAPLPSELFVFAREVGSWWRINSAEVGAAVRESLDSES